ncbi:hypothetical protein ACLB2K_071348 [Fragaria x ananassa]
METVPALNLWSTRSVPSSKFDVFFGNLTILLQRLTEAAAGGNSSLKFAKGNKTILSYSNVDARYSEGLLTAFVQCTPDLSELQCRTCLSGSSEELPKCCDGKEGGRVLRPSCNFKYQLNNTTNPDTAPTPSLAPRNDSEHCSGTSGRSVVGYLVLFAIMTVVLMSTVGGIYMRVAKTRPQPNSGMQPSLFDSMDEHMTQESLQFDCADIRVATNNDYSEANKLGDDAYGTVYKGSLSNEKMVAVQRHPNLVELLGCALEDNSERLLVYELFPNVTLDHIIFDRIKGRQWDWGTRYNIIVSIARGLFHLHGCHFVHGDVKASNILIDAQMNPKISSFGMARFFTVDQTQSSINGIDMLNLITNTNMAPEAIDGHSSAESDVYSFGVLVVEIVRQEITSLSSEKLNEKDLLSFAWKNWAEGTIKNLIDPTLWTGSGIELMESCLRIG